MTTPVLLSGFVCALSASALSSIAVTTPDGWRLGIGDPTFLGWLTVLAYIAAAALCFLSWRHERAVRDDPLMQRSAHFLRPPFWLLLSLLLLALGVNKQLDLQSALTWYGRRLATAQGWYEHRRTVQLIFIALVGASCLSAAGALAWYLRSAWRRYLLALIGTAYLLAFVLIRAASFHHVDDAISEDLGGTRLNVFFELGGIVVIAAAAAAILRRERCR